MSIAVITGSAGLIGSEASLYFAKLGLTVIGLDNDMRRHFFGESASTAWNKQRLEKELGNNYIHKDIDIRDDDSIYKIFRDNGQHIKLVIHTAAQPSHDWAAREPLTDFTVNANGTMNLLEATRKYCPGAVFIFTSTNKVYGDNPNKLPLVELPTRYDVEVEHKYHSGISEDMSVDHCVHSLFGVSKLAADAAVQEYGKYFGIFTACFRGGCLTGPAHSGAELHGFLAYLMKSTACGIPYTVYGYNGKQVRDNIHCGDLISAFHEFFKAPRVGEVYNIGGGRDSNCSMVEAIDLAQQITKRKLNWKYSEQNRTGDHIWWISDLNKFRKHYPGWQINKRVPEILEEIFDFNKQRWLNQLIQPVTQAVTAGTISGVI